MENRKPGTGLTYAAQAQSLLGRHLVFGQGYAINNHQDEPYRFINESPVHVVGKTNIDHDLIFNRSKFSLWGKFYHPYLMNGMPGAGGWNKLYVQKTDNHYVLWVSSKLDPDMAGPSDWVNELWAWTPQQSNDSKVKAGYRMFYAAALLMDYVEEDEHYTSSYDSDPNWHFEWEPSDRCLHVMASIRKTAYSSESEFLKMLEEVPNYLREHIFESAAIDESFKTKYLIENLYGNREHPAKKEAINTLKKFNKKLNKLNYISVHHPMESPQDISPEVLPTWFEELPYED